MTDPSVTRDGVPGPAGRSGSVWRGLGCFLTGLLAAAVATAAVVFSVWPLEPTPAPEPEAAVVATPSNVATERPLPAVMLPSRAVPGTSEQLQEEAERVANALRESFPDLAEALHVVAMLDAQIRQTGEAEELWRKCIELDPRNVGYYVNLAAIAMDRGNSKLAASTLQEALDAGCVSPDVYHHLAVALTNLGRNEEAVTLSQQALAAYPKSPAQWLVLGQAQLKLGNAAEAEASLQKAISLGSRSPGAYFALANACARQGKQEAAAKYRQQFSELKSSRPLDPQRRFQVLSDAESRRTAVAILCEAATVHNRQENSLEAERLFLRAIALEPASVVSCRGLAALYHAAEMKPEERVVRGRLIEIDPYNFVNYLNLAKVCAELGELESAEATLKLAITIRPQAAVAYATLAELHLQEGHAKRARWYAQEAVRREPTAEGYVFLASTCRVLGAEADAEAAMNMARSLQAKKE